MKIFACLSFVILVQTISFGQDKVLDNFNQERRAISQKGLYGLSAYAGANIIYGAIASANTSGSKKYFHQMNAVWNGVTLGIVAVGHFAEKKEKVLTLWQSLQKQNSVEKLFLFNTGLDLAYVAGGAYLRERSKTTAKNPDRLKGYGQAIMLQGGILFLFDGVMYAIHKKHGNNLNGLVSEMQVGFMGNGIGVVLHL